MEDEGEDETCLPAELSSLESQEARAYLRERFLRAVTGIVGKSCEFRMFDNTNVAAEFRGSDVDVMHFFVKQLKTPLGIMPEAVLRTSDIIKVHFPNIDIQVALDNGPNKGDKGTEMYIGRATHQPRTQE